MSELVVRFNCAPRSSNCLLSLLLIAVSFILRVPLLNLPTLPLLCPVVLFNCVLTALWTRRRENLLFLLFSSPLTLTASVFCFFLLFYLTYRERGADTSGSEKRGKVTESFCSVGAVPSGVV